MADKYDGAPEELGGISRRQLLQGAASTGGLLVFGGALAADGYSSTVQGFRPNKATLNLDSFGHGFRTISFAS